MNTENFKMFPGYVVEHSYDHHAYVSKEEFDHYYGVMNLYGEASAEQVMTAILGLPANPSEEDDQITNISAPVGLCRIWTYSPIETPIEDIAIFMTAARLGILSKKEAQYADFSFIALLLRHLEYVAVVLKDGRQIILTDADLLE